MNASRLVVSSTLLALAGALSLSGLASPASVSAATVDYKVLATSKTSTMEKELNEAGGQGYRFASVMGGETLGGNEVVVVVQKDEASGGSKHSYKLLAASKTGTMQKELQAAADEGYEYVGQTVFTSAFGGAEVVVLMGRTDGATAVRHTYQLLATKKTSTMEKELKGVGADGFELLGVTVSKTAFGGTELVSILRKKAGGK